MAASHSRAVLSLLPVGIVLPSGLNATDTHRGIPNGPRGGRWAGRWRRPTSRVVLSSPPVRIVFPSGLSAATHTASTGGWPRGRAVAASQSRTVLSSHTVRMVLPSRLKAAVGSSALPWGKKTPLSSWSWLRQADRLARATRFQSSAPASFAFRSASTVQSIPSPTWPVSKAAWPRSKFRIASRRSDSDSAVLIRPRLVLPGALVLELARQSRYLLVRPGLEVRRRVGPDGRHRAAT